MIAERISALLESLGSTPDDVANQLRDRSITGTPEDPCSCPIANLIKAEIPEAADRSLWDGSDEPGSFFVCRNYVRAPDGEITPPYAVGLFIYGFDNGIDYNDLRDEVDE